MENDKNRAILGLVLAGVGALLLLQTLGLWLSVWGLVWALLFAGGGAVFVVAYLRNRNCWWLMIPGGVLLSVGISIGLQAIAGGPLPNVSGTLVLAGIGAAFTLVYLTQRENWWAVIPSGVMYTLALTSISGPAGPASASVFFAGLGATFVVVYLLPAAKVQMSWAIFPAIGFFALAMVNLAATTNSAGFIVPLAMMVTGVYLVYRWLKPATV